MRTVTTAATLALLLGGAALAQGGALSEADRAFLFKEARGSAYELASAKLAVGKAARPDVRAYAERLVRDHERYNAALEKLGRQEGLSLPTEPDDADTAHLEDLHRLDGAGFDALYVEEALRVNADDKRDGEAEKASTKSQAIKDFMAGFSGMDEEHEKLAKQLDKKG